MVETVAFPGENITNTLIEKEDIIIGPGLSQGIFNEIQAHKAGIVREQTNILYLDTSQKRYYPQLQEPVVGVIEGKMGDGYKVDIGASFPAYLDSLSFEGASKRNKPNLVNGSIVYGRITIASRDMDPEISCIGNSGKAEGLGELSKKGALIQVGLSLARRYDFMLSIL
jgi:exosome complex component RRP40